MDENKCRPTIHSEGRELISRIITFFDNEKSAGTLTFPIENATKRAAAATGKSEATICKIRKESALTSVSDDKLKSPGEKHKTNFRKIELDDFDLCVIRRTVQDFYTVKKEVPTLNNILQTLKEDIDFPGGKEFLRKILIKIGFQFKKCKNQRSFLMERSDIIVRRAAYLRRIRKNDSLVEDKKTVIFLDKTWIHPIYTVGKYWQDNNMLGVMKIDTAGQKWIIVHAGSEEGFISGAYLIFKSKTKSGDYHDEMNFQNFSKWIKEKITHNLPPNCLIVLDNAPYHSVQVNKPPSLASRKAEIQEWLQNKSIRFEADVTKPELLQLVRVNRPPTKYAIDSLFEEHGHETVRLPPYHCELNAIEFIWNMVKLKVAQSNVSQSATEIKNLVDEAIGQISAQDWRTLKAGNRNTGQETV